jgi:hypothetical protein
MFLQLTHVRLSFLSYFSFSNVSNCVLQIMVPYNFTEFFDDLTYQVKNNIIPMSRIDDAVKRILRVKFVMGLFENPLADLSLVNQLGSKVCSQVYYLERFQCSSSIFRNWQNLKCYNQMTCLSRNIENWQGKL